MAQIQPLMPMQFAQSPNYLGQSQNLMNSLKGLQLGSPAASAPATPAGMPGAPGTPVAGAAGPSAMGGPGGPQQVAPVALPGQPGSPMAGPVAPQGMVPTGGGGPIGAPSGILDAIKNMSAPQIVDTLRKMSQGGGQAPGTPQSGVGISGSAALQSAGMLPNQGQ